jgi:hypothetical protein
MVKFWEIQWLVRLELAIKLHFANYHFSSWFFYFLGLFATASYGGTLTWTVPKS